MFLPRLTTVVVFSSVKIKTHYYNNLSLAVVFAQREILRAAETLTSPKQTHPSPIPKRDPSFPSLGVRFGAKAGALARAQ